MLIFARKFKAFSIILFAIFAGCENKSPDFPIDFDSLTAFKNLEAIANINPRYSGSTGAFKNLLFIEEQLSAAGVTSEKIEWEEYTPAGKIKFRNLSARIEIDKKLPWIILGAHYDTKKLENIPKFQGANDGASCVAILIEIAKIFWKQKSKMRKNLEIVFFDGEESYFQYSDNDGLHGSKKHLKVITNEKRHVEAVIIADMLADKDLNAFVSADSNPHLTDLFIETVRELKYEKFFKRGKISMVDDHKPFSDHGIPSILIIDFDYGQNNIFWHSPGDNLSNVSKESLEISGKTLCFFIKKLVL